MALCVSDVERWRVAPDPKGPSDSEPRNVATPVASEASAGDTPKKLQYY